MYIDSPFGVGALLESWTRAFNLRNLMQGPAVYSHSALLSCRPGRQSGGSGSSLELAQWLLDSTLGHHQPDWPEWSPWGTCCGC